MPQSSKTPITFSSKELRLIQRIIRSYAAPPNIQAEVLSIYEKIDNHLHS